MVDDATARVRPLLRIKQVREFTDEPVGKDALEALLEVARWSGSSANSQPWRFIAIEDLATIRRIADVGMTQTRGLQTAMAAIAIVLPDEPEREASRAYDDGRVAERLLIGAALLDLGAGISWITMAHRAEVAAILGLPAGRMVRTIIGIGRPSAAARRPRKAPREARLPRSELVFNERWPGGS